MFGFITVNKQELKFKEFDCYHEYYCGLCNTLKKSFGRRAQLSLSYDMTFLVMLLTSLYEPENCHSCCRCFAHPFKKNTYRTNKYTDYVADMTLVLSYYKCMDDWADDKRMSRKAYADLIKKNVQALSERYPEKASVIKDNLDALTAAEAANETNIDKLSGIFGNIMSEIFVVDKDMWEPHLRRIGFYMGKFIYILDAYVDLEEDIKKKHFNPLASKDVNIDAWIKQLLTMISAECAKEFEKLPLVEHVEILRNIIYSGMWTQYELKLNKNNKKKDSSNEKSL